MGIVHFISPEEELLRHVSAERDAFKDLTEEMAIALAIARFGHADACVGHTVIGPRGYAFAIERNESGALVATLVTEAA